jgi:phage baseplate assembly protein W
MNIAYPYEFDSRGRTATACYNDHVNDMIEQLIFTSPGERVNHPDFGSGLLQLVFAGNSPELAATVQFTLQAAIQLWLGDVVQVQSVAVQAVDSTLTVNLSYLIRATNQEQTSIFSRPV